MNKHQYSQPPETEGQLNRVSGYPLKVINFFRGMSTEHKVIWSIVLFSILLLIGGVWFLSAQGAKDAEKLAKPSLGEEMPDQGGPHIDVGAEHPAYNSNPPTSGWMYEGLAGPGIHDTQVPDESLLHSMEHGGVVVHYKADLPQDQIEQVKKAFNEASGKKILVPRNDLDAPVALTSWRRLLKLQNVDEAKIKEFIETNSGRGTENGPI